MQQTKLQGISLEQLRKELQRRQRSLPRLQARREKLVAQLAEIDAQLADLDVTGKKYPGLVGRRRPKNEAPLPDMLASVMSKSKPIKVSDLVQEVQKAGYKTTSENFSTIVNQALIRENKRFKKVSRGMYVLA